MSSPQRPRVAIVGAHRAVSPILTELMDGAVELVRLTTLDHVDASTSPVSVEAVAGAAVVVLAMDGGPAMAAAEHARAEGAVVIDLTGRLVDAKILWPFSGLPERIERGAAYGIIPGLAGPIGAVIGALSAFRPRLAVISTLESAAIADQPGIDALTDQVRSLLAFREPEPGIFGDRLAFNVIPTVGDDEAAELVMAAHIRAAAGAGAPLIRLARHLVPTYSGEGASIDLAVEGVPLTDAVVSAIGALDGVRLGRVDAPTPHDAGDRDEILLGRLRVGPGRIALWMAADRLRSATAVPVARVIRAALGL